MAIGTTAVSIGGVLPNFSASSYRNIVGANDRIRMAGIRVNSGDAWLKGLPMKENGCIVTDICDVDTGAIEVCTGR